MRPNNIVAIASGKGGVGKTWLAISLARALALSGRRALLFDGDLGLANIDVQLGLHPRHDIADILAGRVAPEDAVLHHEAGFDILAGRSGNAALASLPETMLAALATVPGLIADRYDTVIVDLAAGVDATMRRLTTVAGSMLLVATAEPTSLTDAYAVLKRLGRECPALDPAIVINMAGSLAGGRATHSTLARAASRFLGRAPRLAGIIRRDPAVLTAIRRQTLPPLATAACEDATALANAWFGAAEHGGRSTSRRDVAAAGR
ncbi:MAG: AAA family ATPase [Rhodospirillales bacterium]|nr:AAA family ATPase [Rhodospirillales bacterium]